MFNQPCWRCSSL